jgi:hypothetical protein
MLDLRRTALERTANGNRNILTLFNNLEHLWDTKLVAMEHSIGRQYDYIMILRDDTLWLDDFDLNKLLAVNPAADAYVLSCDAREPAMLSPEMNDHAIVLKREKAAVVGRYFSSLLSADLEACHKSVKQTLGLVADNRGCNSEMILKWILQENNVTVQGVPQSLLPFERSVVVRSKGGKKQTCFHKFCQSKEAPLEIPENIPMCKDIEWRSSKRRQDKRGVRQKASA